MAEFVIKMADERGHMTQQVEDARSEAEVRDRFAQQGFFVYSVKPLGLFAGGKLGVPRSRRIKLAQFVVFNQQLVTLIRAGLPILHALDLLLKQQRNEYFASVLQGVRDRVKNGELLSEAFEHQNAFPRIYTTTLLAGEKSGNLDEVLNRYVHFQRLALSFRKKLLASLIYPALLIVMVSLLLTFLVTYVVPRFAELYSQLGAQLPAITQFMLTVGLAAQKYFPLFVAAFALLIFGVWRAVTTQAGAQRLDRIRLALPLVGNIWLKYQVAIFARTMATLLTGGIPLVSALETASESMQSPALARAIAQAGQSVREGRTLARSLEEAGHFSELSVEMIEVGESTGALPAMLTSVAEFYEEDVETALTAALSLIEPAILVVMAGVVGLVLISLYLPIFKLGSGGVIH